MSQNEFEKIKRYESLQDEYKNLLSEYEELKTSNPYNLQLTNKIVELTAKQKEIETSLSELKEI
ncbi:hypothetical protein [Nitrosopumilus maritimus]|uniref:hypothetical protein n=1 Tax=Nitrosopumilus maritimus TaxID=338192 RepID=UPI000A5D879D|nr:hypothetical protein [Nitrosopumilus maritimus]